MKKITSKSLQTALLRGAVAVSGCMAITTTALFFDSIYGVVVTLCLGAGIMALIDNAIIINSKNKMK